MSFDSSEMSYFSARQQRMKSEDQDSVAGMAELHSQSVTPTPDEEQQHLLLPLPLPQAIQIGQRGGRIQFGHWHYDGAGAQDVQRPHAGGELHIGQ